MAPRPRRAWPRPLSVLVAALLALGLSVAPPVARPVEAADSLALAVDATYSVDPEAGRVRVVMDVEATNLQPAEGNVVYYYTEILFGVQPEATRIRAVDAAGGLEATIRRRADFVSVTVSLRSPLFYRDTARFRIRYDLVGGEPRSESPIRVGAAFVTFGVWAWGDADRSSVEVRLPPGFESQALGDAMELVDDPAGQRLQARPSNPFSFYAVVDAEHPAAYEPTWLSLEGGVQLVILGWPEDDAWQATVASTLQAGMPVLQELIGLDWPVRHDLEVRERYTPALEGYAGVFYRDESIDVSEDLDPQVIVHEASHAWFNDTLFEGRWIYEGLAQEYSWRVLSELGDATEQPVRPSPDDPGAVALTTWSHPGAIRDQDTEASEQYGYEASWWVIRQIVTIAGEARMRWAFGAAQSHETAYPGAGAPEASFVAAGWTRFYDLVEDIAEPPSPVLDEAFRQIVLSPDQVPLLDVRRSAREAYRALVAAGDGWLPPWYVRRPMNEWRFDVAEGRIDEAGAVLELRDRVTDEASVLELQPGDGLRTAYERAAADLADAAVLAEQQLSALDTIDDARAGLAEERDLVTAIGLLDAVPERSYDDARAAFEAGDLDAATRLAAATLAVLGGATAVGQQRLLVAAAVTLALVVLLLLLAAVLRRRRRRRAPAEVPGEPYATLAADSNAPSAAPAEAPLDGGTSEGGPAVDR